MLSVFITSFYRLKSHIKNEPLWNFSMPKTEDSLAQAQSGSLPTTLAETIKSPLSPSGVSVGVDTSVSSGSLTSLPSLPSGGHMGSPCTPFKGRDGRHTSLGKMMMTSPSTRRRSLESTISMIQEVLDEKDLVGFCKHAGLLKFP
ncbi:hypothetical protein BDR03DRAFT_966709 [Suillus americanus]|nr:hypothetical protein BDR03DRAFT_966709 [Suillus americanus]